MSRLRPLALPLLTLALIGLVAVDAPRAEDGYQMPPQSLVDIVDAPPTPSMSVSPDRTQMLLTQRPNLMSIDDLSERELRLAGLRLRPRTSGRSRVRYAEKLSFMPMEGGEAREVTGLPARPKLSSAMWNQDGSWIAFTHTAETGIELWVAEVKTAKARRLVGPRLNGSAGSPCEWVGNDSLVCMAIPGDRGDEPPAPRVPSGPVIQENAGKKSPARTYQDLLKTPHDETLFEHYLTSQLIAIDMDGNARPLGKAGIVWGFEPSPDGKYLMVQSLHRPFSYLVPGYRFPRRTEIWDLQGRVVKQIADTPLQEGVPIAFGSVVTGPRSFAWRDDAPATVHWTEAQDGGDAGAEAEVRDKVFVLDAPFDGEPEVLATLGLRYGGVEWGNDDLALVYSWWWKTRTQRTWIVKPAKLAQEPELLYERSWEDRYSDPGDFVSRRNEYGRYSLMIGDKGRTLYLIGDGASPEGDRPFFDSMDIKSKETTRLFRSEAPYFERPWLPLDDKARMLLVRRESRDEQPNYYVRDLKKDRLEQITDFPHPTPSLAGLEKELIRYERADGVQLTGTLYLPPGYDKSQGPLPVLLWAYPEEFKSADAAGQVRDSPYRFDRVGWWSPLPFLTRGYAVLDDPSMPVIGEGDEEPNDTFVEQLVTSAQAALDELGRRGVADPNRAAVGGHSYGAFMTANLLAHSDLFRAGIARSGAYNRTLTPFGFQAEERTLWQSPNIYFEMSPFMHAEKINEPILLIHGDSDNNSGTYPMQSERYFNALKGLGATARLVMLPDESHGYRARESILHMMWEMDSWLERYVKPLEAQAQLQD